MQTEVIKIEDDFDIQKIAKSGQCFRIGNFSDGWFRFASGKHILYIRRLTGLPGGAGAEFEVTASKQEWDNIWVPYFDLSRNYAKLRKLAEGTGNFMETAVECGAGLRLLRQEPWEMLLTFIISQRKSIPAIAKSVESLAALCGTRAETPFESFYLFPTAEQMAEVTQKELESCGVGYRAPYLLDAVRKVAGSRLNLSDIAELDDACLLERLQTVHGVGKKVANCVALFAYGRTACVPVDVWIARAIEEDCGGKNPFPGFGKAAGIFQQYVFYYQKNGKKAAEKK